MHRRALTSMLVLAAALGLPAAAAAHAISAPATVAIVAGPANGTIVRTATVRFAFAVRHGRAAARCRLDAGASAPCRAAVTYRSLADGRHTFSVTLTGSHSAASRRFTVHAAPTITITSGPRTGSTVHTASVGFGYAARAATSVRCRIDAAQATACVPSPQTYTLAPGRHTFRISAAGRYGTATSARTFTVAVAPTVRFTSGPANGATITVTHAAYTFTAPGATAATCRLDGTRVTCRLGHALALRNLRAGHHVLSVAARDRWGTGTTTRSFRVVVPPVIADLRVNGRRPRRGPDGDVVAVSSGTLRFTWTAGGSAATESCRFGDTIGRCASGVVREVDGPGEYRFTLTLTNAAGSVSRTVSILVG
ncbi:MAG TPA: hypothetical protein VGL44_10060 [Gaiellales bacterium]|jgi:hypothetical protein